MTETPATVPATVPRVTTARYKHLRSVDEIPGDPLNVGIVGSEAALKRAMLAAGWFPADPLTMRSCAEIAGAVFSPPIAPISSNAIAPRAKTSSGRRTMRSA